MQYEPLSSHANAQELLGGWLLSSAGPVKAISLMGNQNGQARR